MARRNVVVHDQPHIVAGMQRYGTLSLVVCSSSSSSSRSGSGCGSGSGSGSSSSK